MWCLCVDPAPHAAPPRDPVLFSISGWFVLEMTGPPPSYQGAARYSKLAVSVGVVSDA